MLISSATKHRPPGLAVLLPLIHIGTFTVFLWSLCQLLGSLWRSWLSDCILFIESVPTNMIYDFILNIFNYLTICSLIQKYFYTEMSTLCHQKYIKHMFSENIYNIKPTQSSFSYNVTQSALHVNILPKTHSPINFMPLLSHQPFCHTLTFLGP